MSRYERRRPAIRTATLATGLAIALGGGVLAGGPARAQLAIATNFAGSAAGVSIDWDYKSLSYGSAPPLPTGVWNDQYMNFFNGVPTPPGPMWNTWSSLAKPTTLAGWTGTYYSNPFLRSDTKRGSVDRNGTRLRLSTGIFNPKALYATKLVIATASARLAADSPAIAHTRITDPSTFTDPVSGDDWSLETNYSQLGSIRGSNTDTDLIAQYGITLDPTSGPPVTYNLFSVDIDADGAASVTSDLNGNDASVSGKLVSGQLNGILLMNGVAVTPTQAEEDLLSMYSPSTGWNLNPEGYSFTSFDPSNPSQLAHVFNFSAIVFLDPSTASASIDTIDEADAASTALAPTPEPAAWTLLVVGVAGVGAAVRIRRRARAIRAVVIPV
ncbi:MAG: hypothetical protein JO111_08545 [Caulobacteraceae bacterium]|nr:hypothetical protein [Caulobacteraceae bacterium]